MNRGDSITWRWSGAGRHELGDRRSRPGRELRVRPRPSDRRHQPRSRGDLPTRRERRVRSLPLQSPSPFMRGSVTVAPCPTTEPRASTRFGHLPGARLRFTVSERASLSGRIRRIGTPLSPAPVPTSRVNGRSAATRSVWRRPGFGLPATASRSEPRTRSGTCQSPPERASRQGEQARPAIARHAYRSWSVTSRRRWLLCYPAGPAGARSGWAFCAVPTSRRRGAAQRRQ